MTALAKKLQLEADGLRIVNRPDGVAAELSHASDADAVLVFVGDRAELGAAEPELVANASADRLTWVAFPKAGQLDTDLNRDRVAAALIAAGIRPVRNVSIDEVWSALRFRPGG